MKKEKGKSIIKYQRWNIFSSYLSITTKKFILTLKFFSFTPIFMQQILRIFHATNLDELFFWSLNCHLREKTNLWPKVRSPPFPAIFDRTCQTHVTVISNFRRWHEMTRHIFSENLSKRYWKDEKLDQKHFFGRGVNELLAATEH